MAENNFYPTNRISLDSYIAFKPLLDVRAKVDYYSDLTNLNYWKVGKDSYLNVGQITYVVNGDNDGHPSGLYVCINNETPVWEQIRGSVNETQVQITSDGTINSSDYQSKSDGVYVASENISGVADKGDVVVVSGGTCTKLNLKGDGVTFSNSGSWTGLVGYNGNSLVKTDLNKDILVAIGNESKQYLGYLTITDADSGNTLFEGIVGNTDEITLNGYHLVDESIENSFLTITDDVIDVETNEGTETQSQLYIALNIQTAANYIAEGNDSIDVYDDVDTLITLNISYTHIRELPASANHSHAKLTPHNLAVTFPEGYTKTFTGWNATSLDLSIDAPSINAEFVTLPTAWTTSTATWKDISHIYFNNKKVTFIYNDTNLKAGWYNKNLLVIKPNESNKIQWYIINPKNVTAVSFDEFVPIADAIPLWTNSSDGTKRLYVTSSEYIEYYEQA